MPAYGLHPQKLWDQNLQSISPNFTVKKVSYKSSKKKVVTVDKNGKVKALRKGKAVITVKVELDSGAVKKFNLKVNVGTRTVKVTKKK